MNSTSNDSRPPARALDYSKWNNIELSDDDDAHPGAQFIERDTLRRLKRESHVERERMRIAKVNDATNALRRARNDVKECERAVVQAHDDFEGRHGTSRGESSANDDGGREAEDWRETARALERARERVKEIEHTIERLEREKKFNAEEMCYVASEKTVVIGVGDGASEKRGADLDYETYVGKFKGVLDEIAKENARMTYGELGEWFRDGHTDLLHEHATGYLLLKALYAQMEKKYGEARTCARVAFACKSIGEFAEAGKTSARDAARPFFERIDSNDAVATAYEKSFEDYFAKLRERAATKLAEEAASVKTAEAASDREPTSLEEIPREDRLGPGGLDPVEVYDALPEAMRAAFDAGDVAALKTYVNALPLEEARAHMKKMVDSGLWVPTPGEDPGEALR